MHLPPSPPWLYPRAAYVHVPFCAHQCGYCDFAVAVGQDQQIDAYLDALAMELATLGRPRAVRTLFIGGGTPSHLDVRQLERLLTMLHHWLPVRGQVAESEFSLEANPDSLDADKIALLAERGVTRVSLGAQSFQPDVLRVLERQHRAEEVAVVVEQLKRKIPFVSLDLIFGVPGQTLAAWDRDLRHALALAPDHLSTYGLTFEKGTRLWKQRQRGELRPLEEDTELAQYRHAMDTLQAAGFEHYEISNFAQPGCRSRHNQVYWANHAYWGFGVGAARYVHGCRQLNTRSLSTYLNKVLTGESPVFQSETLPPKERARETIAVQLRRADGIERRAFREQTGYDVDTLVGPKIAELQELGLLDDDGRRICLTRPGKCVADAVIMRLM
ncbi:MAG: radical SAM family heme chaperone HemW [Gemmataceae bacterium]